MSPLLWVVVIFGNLFLLLFLAGMLSAAYDAHRERKAGLPVSRPAWDARADRKATGGRWATVRGTIKGIRS